MSYKSCTERCGFYDDSNVNPFCQVDNILVHYGAQCSFDLREGEIYDIEDVRRHKNIILRGDGKPLTEEQIDRELMMDDLEREIYEEDSDEMPF